MDRLTEAQQRLVADNRGIAGAVARRYIGRGIEFRELRSLGYLAMCEAALTWSPERGCKFTTYAFRACVYKLSEAFYHLHCKDRWRAGCCAPLRRDCQTPARAPGPPPDEIDELWDAIRRLPARAQVVIVGRMEGRLHREIGSEIGCGAKMSERIARCAMRTLRERLA
jgi:DNA-directed RNA polymerase specialized sigma subunit